MDLGAGAAGYRWRLQVVRDRVETRSLAIFLPTLLIGGAEKVAVEIANALSDDGWSVEILVMDARGPLANELSDKIQIKSIGASSYRQAVARLAKIYDSDRPDIVLSTLYINNVVAIAAKMFSRYKPRVIAGAHNSFRFKITRPDNWKDKFLLYPLSFLFLPYADATIAVSQGVADELMRMLRLKKKRVHVVYNPVVTPELIEKSHDPLEHPWLRKGRSFETLISVGRLVEQKGFDMLLMALAEVRRSRDVRLIIIGDGPLHASLVELATSLQIRKYVDLLGSRSNPYKYVSRADLFVLPSRWEGLGNVVIEALACGCPVVATDCNFGPREILEGGRFGYLSAVNDPAALSAAILAALNEPLTSHRKSPIFLRQRANYFSREASVEGYKSVFQKVIAS